MEDFKKKVEIAERIKGWNESIEEPRRQTRIEALKIASEIVLKITHFEPKYKNLNSFFKDLNLLYKVADRNYEYILTGKIPHDDKNEIIEGENDVTSF